MAKTWYGHHIENIKGEDYVLFKDYLELDKEIERLNHECDTYLKIATKRKNIIDELKKWLESEIDRITKLKNPKKGIKPYGEENYYYENMILRYKEVLDKLKELKENK